MATAAPLRLSGAVYTSDVTRTDGGTTAFRHGRAQAARVAAHIIAYRDHFEFFMDRAYDYDLWAVAYIMRQGCSDDWFDYFRAWLISLGREQYEAALDNPELVSEILKATRAEDIFSEQFTYVARDAYRNATGKRLPESTTKRPGLHGYKLVG